MRSIKRVQVTMKAKLQMFENGNSFHHFIYICGDTLFGEQFVTLGFATLTFYCIFISSFCICPSGGQP